MILIMKFSFVGLASTESKETQQKKSQIIWTNKIADDPTMLGAKKDFPTWQ